MLSSSRLSIRTVNTEREPKGSGVGISKACRKLRATIYCRSLARKSRQRAWRLPEGIAPDGCAPLRYCVPTMGSRVSRGHATCLMNPTTVQCQKLLGFHRCRVSLLYQKRLPLCLLSGEGHWCQISPSPLRGTLIDLGRSRVTAPDLNHLKI